MCRKIASVVVVKLALMTLATAQTAAAQTKDDFEYWDANGNGDLTCSEAVGRDEGLRLPAYRDNRNSTRITYEWLQRGRRSDSDGDGAACERNSNPNGYVPRADGSGDGDDDDGNDDDGGDGGGGSSSRGCPAGSPTWMGLRVCEESPRRGYNRDAFGTGYRSLEDDIIDDLPKSGGQVYTPYTCALFDIRPDGTAATDIEHIVALAEAYDSGLAESRYRAFAADLDNLTIAAPNVNRSQKSDRDVGDWGPPRNRGWFASRVVAVKREYALAVNPAERDALARMLSSDPSRRVTCAGGSGGGGDDGGGGGDDGGGGGAGDGGGGGGDDSIEGQLRRKAEEMRSAGGGQGGNLDQQSQPNAVATTSVPVLPGVGLAVLAIVLLAGGVKSHVRNAQRGDPHPVPIAETGGELGRGF